MDVNSNSPNHQTTATGSPILIVADHRGHLEAFGESSVEVKFLQLPASDDPLICVSAMQFLEGKLPARFQKVWWPDRCLGSHQVEQVSPQEFVRRQHNAILFDQLTALEDRRTA